MLQEKDDHLCTSLCSNQVEAEVIVHSELSDPSGEEEEEEGNSAVSNSTRGPSLLEDVYSPLSEPSSTVREDHLENLIVAKSLQSLPKRTILAHHNGEAEGNVEQQNSDTETQPDNCLTNGFHSPNTSRSVLRSEHLVTEDSRHCPAAAGKAVSAGLPPAPFVSSGSVHSTSAPHTYLCP